MANTAIGVDWTRWGHQEREIFAEWDPGRDWIRRQNDSNLGC